MKFATKVLSYKGSQDDSYGALRTPIYANAAFEYGSAEQLEDVFSSKKSGHVYSRASNPTVEELEYKVKCATDALGTVALSSGMAAIASTLLALLQSGDNIVTTNKLFGHTLSFLHWLYEDFCIEIRYVDINDLQQIQANIDTKTKLVFCESMSNPGLIVPDFKAVAAITQAANIPFIVDTTMTPWPLFDVKAHGIDVEIISATKFLSGGGTVVGGLIVDYGTYDWSANAKLRSLSQKFGKTALLKKLKKQTARDLGGALSPFAAYMISLGMETLAMRVKKASKNAFKIAQYLQTQDMITAVNYPGLDENSFYELVQTQFRAAGSIISFEFIDKDTAYRFMNALTIIKRCTNIQDNKSLVIAPYHTIYAQYTQTQKKEFGLSQGSVRLSVGIESPKDLIGDIAQALQTVKEKN
ncbi:MAG: aminotransferase class V-fold PLP-dependent enzyme [Campylobacterota bacterium]